MRTALMPLWITNSCFCYVCDWWCVFLVPATDKLPYSIRILLESAIRNCDSFQVTKEDVEKIIDWENTSPKQVEIPFKPARVILQVCHKPAKYCFHDSNVFMLQPISSVARILLGCRLLLTLLLCVMPWASLAVIQIRSILWCVSFLSRNSFKIKSLGFIIEFLF